MILQVQWLKLETLISLNFLKDQVLWPWRDRDPMIKGHSEVDYPLECPIHIFFIRNTVLIPEIWSILSVYFPLVDGLDWTNYDQRWSSIVYYFLMMFFFQDYKIYTLLCKTRPSLMHFIWWFLGSGNRQCGYNFRSQELPSLNESCNILNTTRIYLVGTISGWHIC